MVGILTLRPVAGRSVDTKSSGANTRAAGLRRTQTTDHTMTSTERTQGGLICLGAVAAALFFVVGLFRGSYWALAIPVAILVLFLLGLVFWVGFTIATIQIEPEIDDPLPDPETSDPSQPDA